MSEGTHVFVDKSWSVLESTLPFNKAAAVARLLLVY